MDGPNRSSNVTLVSPDSKGKEVGQAELMPHRDRKSTAHIAVGPIASRLAKHRDLTATSHSYAKTVGVLVGTLGLVAVTFAAMHQWRDRPDYSPTTAKHMHMVPNLNLHMAATPQPLNSDDLAAPTPVEVAKTLANVPTIECNPEVHQVADFAPVWATTTQVALYTTTTSSPFEGMGLNGHGNPPAVAADAKWGLKRPTPLVTVAGREVDFNRIEMLLPSHEFKTLDARDDVTIERTATLPIQVDHAEDRQENVASESISNSTTQPPRQVARALAVYRRRLAQLRKAKENRRGHARAFYQAAAELADVARNGDQLEEAARLEFAQIYSDPRLLRFMGTAARNWIAWPKRATPGIVIAGHARMTATNEDGMLLSIKTPRDSAILVRVASSSEVSLGEPVVVVGAIVEDTDGAATVVGTLLPNDVRVDHSGG